MTYTKQVGVKFDEKGNPLKIPGNTVICFINTENNSILFEELIWAQAELKKLSFSHKYAVLPPSSFHMTVIELLMDRYRDAPFWPSMLKRDKELSEIDTLYQSIIDSIEKNKFTMKIDRADDTKFILSPYNEENRKLLKKYRDLVAEKTGLRFDNHDQYRFHISLFYQLQTLIPEEEKELASVLEKINQRVLNRIKYFNTDEPKFTIFNDIYMFSEDLSARRVEDISKRFSS